MINEILSKFGLKMEDLTTAERETLRSWLASAPEITVEKIKNHIRSMLSAVEDELSTHKLPVLSDIFLKARLRNYLLLLEFLEAPEKARKTLEEQLKNIK